MISSISYILDITIAVLFFLPFYMKLRNFEEFKVEIYSYKILPVSMLSLVSFLVLMVEFLLFFFFATGMAEGWKHFMGIGLLIVFTGLAWRKKRITGIETCACYGDISFLNKYPIYRNILLLIILFIDLSIRQGSKDFYSMILSISLVMALSFTAEIIQLFQNRNEA